MSESSTTPSPSSLGSTTHIPSEKAHNSSSDVQDGSPGNVNHQPQVLGEAIAVKINKDFARIETSVDKIDKMIDKLKKSGSKGVKGGFLPRWRELYDRYTDLIQESRRSAITLGSSISNFLQGVIPILEGAQHDIDAKRAALTGYIEALEAFEPKGTRLSGKFTRLLKDVAAFREDLKAQATKLPQTQKSFIERTEKAIRSVEKQLRGDNTMTANGIMQGVAGTAVVGEGVFQLKSAALGGKVALRLAAGAPKVSVLAPCCMWAFVIIGGLSIVGLLAYEEYSRRRQVANFQDLLEDRKLHNTLISEGGKVQTALVGLVEALGRLHSAWQELLDNAQTLLDNLQACQKYTEPVILNLVGDLKTIYGALQTALDHFIASTNPASISAGI